MNKNSSQSSTAATDNSTGFDPVSRSLRKQLIIFLLFFVALTSFLTISGCAPTQAAFPSRTLSTNTSTDSDEETLPSRSREATFSQDSQPDFTYRTLRSSPLPTQRTAEPSAKGSVNVNQERLVRLDHEIGEATVSAANDLIALADRSQEPIEVYIHSPGGSVNSGLLFIEAMKQVQERGIIIKCYVPDFAASMAFTIFTQCNERYALPYARLLFHAPRISGNLLLTPEFASYLTSRLIMIERVLLSLIVPVMGVDKATADWFGKNYSQERLFLANELLAESPTPWFKIVARMESK